MPSNREVVADMYAALRRADPQALLRLLHQDCVIRTSPGLPVAGGRVAAGPQEALSLIWGEVYRHFDVFPEPEELLQDADGTIVGIGVYRGTARASGRSFQAWFAHRWTVADGRVAGLRQITDTVAWRQAMEDG